MSRSRRSRSGGGDGGGGGHDGSGSGRWMVSYMDMVTVLMCLFIVLFAMSAVDQNKYQELKASLAAGFGTVPDPNAVEVVEAVEARLEVPAVEEAEVDAELERATAEVSDLTALRDAMFRDLADRGMSDDVRFEIDERGLTVRLVSADTFFSSSSAELSADAREVLEVVGPALEPTSYQIRVEGHADEIALHHAVFPTNWELSAARATAVLRHLVTTGSAEGEQIAAVGYGSARPLVEGVDARSLAANRRVDVVVLSSEPEAVRALIPGVLTGAEGADAAS
jgi:chemotaxis protein MotB